METVLEIAQKEMKCKTRFTLYGEDAVTDLNVLKVA